MSPPVVSTVRTPATFARRETRRPERVQARGPQTMGQPLDGTYASLHAVWWRLDWRRGSAGLVLSRDGPDGWEDVAPGQAFPALPVSARHIGLAFDQSARHVLCWEEAGQIRVRQWNANSQAYVHRGPFDGVDPVLFTDSTAQADPTDSDVILFYLDAARTAISYRLQRDAYGVEYQALDGLSGAVLDQVVSRDHAAQLLGQDDTGELVLEIGYYPWILSSVSAAIAMGVFTSGLYFNTQIALETSDLSAASGCMVGGLWYASTMPIDTANTSAASARMVSGLFQSTITAVSRANANSATGKMLSGLYQSTNVALTQSNTNSAMARFLSGLYFQAQLPATGANSNSATARITGGIKNVV